MHAIILAGGFGTRLKSVVADVPKPLAPINGRPFLELLIARLASQGVTSVTLSVHHMREEMERFVSERSFNIPVNIIVEETPLGTGGAMQFCLSKLNNMLPIPHPDPLPKGEGVAGFARMNDSRMEQQRPLSLRERVGVREPVLVLNGDSFVQVDCGRLYAHHLAKKTPLTLTLRKVQDTSRYSKIITRNNTVTHFLTLGDAQPGFINAGVYVMRPDLFEQFPMQDEAFSFERDFMPKYVKQLKAASFIADDYFIDIGVPEDYARAQVELKEWC